MPKNLGFSLIELLITLTIIAVLAAIGLVTYTTVLKGARDSDREADLKVIHSALEQYRLDQTYFPLPNNSGEIGTNCTGATSYGRFKLACPLTNLVGSSFNKTYLNLVPKDPFYANTSTSQYKYEAHPLTPTACDNATPATRCTNFCLYAKLENVITAPTPPLPCSFSGANSGFNFVVTAL